MGDSHATGKGCRGCGETKTLGDFYKHPHTRDGRQGKCRSCASAAASENYRKNRDYYIAYDKERGKCPARRAYKVATTRALRARNPDKANAWNRVSNAIRDGRLVRGPCEECGSVSTEAHHDDYAAPLDVRWLCRKHHLKHHGKEAY